MALKKLYIDTVEELTYITHPELHAKAEIFQVMRKSKMQMPTTGTPSSTVPTRRSAAPAS
jgi:hypothetical protein